MKVLVVGTSGEVVSGITTAADQTVRTLQAEGVTVERLAAGDRRRRRPSRLNTQNVLAVLVDAWRVLRRARSMRADIVWYHTFGVPTLSALRSLAVVLAARAAGARPFVRLHPYGFDSWLVEGGRPLWLVMRVLDRVAAGLVVEFDEAARSLRERTGARSVSVLPNWVDVPPIPVPLPDGPPFVLAFVGGLIERKGIYELLEAMRLLPNDVHLLAVGGPGEDGEGAATRFDAASADLVASGRLEVVGEVDATAVRQALRQAHLFVLPTSAEGLPLAMLEAMAEGRPVLVGDAGDIRRVVEEVGCGRVLARTDPSSVASVIAEQIRSPELGEVGERGHAHAIALAGDARARLLRTVGR